MKVLHNLRLSINYQLKENKSSFIVYSILRIIVLIVAILQYKNKNYENVFLCILTLLLFIVPSFIQATLNIEIPKVLEIIIYIFIFSAEILGEINDYYLIIPFWDTMLHTINGFLAAAIGFSLIDLLNNIDEIEFKLSPFFFVLVSFCFSMTIGVLWEFFEFGADWILNIDSQKDMIVHTINTVSFNGTLTHINDIKEVIVNGQVLPINGYLDIGLIDTMKDLIVNFIGAVTFSFFGFFYLKKQENHNFIKNFLPFRK